MSRTRKRYSHQFKAKVALTALREDKSQAELASQFGVSATMISRWKKTLLEEASSLFEGPNRSNQPNNEELISSLYEQIGRLKVELDWLKKTKDSLR